MGSRKSAFSSAPLRPELNLSDRGCAGSRWMRVISAEVIDPICLRASLAMPNTDTAWNVTRVVRGGGSGARRHCAASAAGRLHPSSARCC
eukprot:809163-Rhodomonas_salina.2